MEYKSENILNEITETPKPQIEPLTYLALILANFQPEEIKSGVDGLYYNDDGVCAKYIIKPTGRIECATKGEKLPNVPLNPKEQADAEQKLADAIAAINAKVKADKELIAANEQLKTEVNKAGGGNKFWENLNNFFKSDTGKSIVPIAAGLLGNQAPPTVDVNNDLYGGANPPSKGLDPVWWVVIAVGGVILLTGIGYGIYRFGIKPKQAQR